MIDLYLLFIFVKGLKFLARTKFLALAAFIFQYERLFMQYL